MKIKSLNLALLIVFITLALFGCTSDESLKPSEDVKIIEPFKVYKKDYVTVYFVDEKLEKLSEKAVKVEERGIPIEEFLAKTLKQGPKSKDIKTIIPSDVEFLSIDLIDKVAYLNLSKNISKEDMTENEEALLLYSIVNTFTGFDNIDKVQILINGEIKEVLSKHYSIEEPLEFCEALTEKYINPMQAIAEYYDAIIKRHSYKLQEKIYKYDIRGYSVLLDLFADKRFSDVENFIFENYKINGYGDYFKVEFKMSLEYKDGTKKEFDESINIIYENQRLYME